jgi:hypothetical protein
MSIQALSLRRRAAYAVLSPLLEENALIDALRLQHQSMRGDSVSDIIGYIDQVAARHHIDAASRKKLYEAYYKALKRPEGELPMDPWPLMQIDTAPVAPPVVSAAALEPVSAAMQAAAPALIAAASPDRAVCAELLRTALAEVQRFHASALSDLHHGVLEQLDQGGLSQAVRKQVREAWAQPRQAAWVIEGSPQELSLVVHQFYVAMCEALGPVDADQVLTRAVRAADQMPQARQFSPRKLI